MAHSEWDETKYSSFRVYEFHLKQTLVTLPVSQNPHLHNPP